VTGLLLVLILGLGHGPLDAPAFRNLVLLALPAGLVAVLLVFLWIPKVPRVVPTRPLAWSNPTEIRGYLALVLLFGLANSSDSFLVLRAKELGFSFREILGLLLVFNLLAALLALPAGRWSDRTGRVRFLAAGWAVYGLAYGAMALSPGRGGFAVALLAYGAFYGLTEGVEKALLGDLLHPEHRGTGYGALQLALGLTALVASLLMGLLMTAWGSRLAFLATGGLALLAAGVVWAVG